MAIKLINHYQAWWDAADNQGYFWFTYFDGDRHRTGPIQPDNFRILLDLLRNESPVYGDHTVPMVTTQTEPTGEGEQPILIVPSLPTPLADLPNSDNVLSCFVNFNAGALVYHTSNDQYVLKQQNGAPFILPTKVEQIKSEVLIASMSAVSDWRAYKHRAALKADFQPTYETAREVITTRFPNIILGSYLSGRQAKSEQHQSKEGWYMEEQSVEDKDNSSTCLKNGRCCNSHYYPIPRTPIEKFSTDELITSPEGSSPFTLQAYKRLEKEGKLGPFPYCTKESGDQNIYFESTVDHRNPSAAKKLLTYAVAEAKKRKLKLLYSDNWSYISYENITWTDVANYLQQLKQALHQEGIRLIINIWWPIGRNKDFQQEMKDIDRLAQVTDGLSIEGAFLHPEIHQDINAIKKSIALTRYMLQKGLLLIFIKANLKPPRQ